MKKVSFTPSESLNDLFPALFRSNILLQSLYYHTLSGVFCHLPDTRKRNYNELSQKQLVTTVCDDLFNNELEGAVSQMAKAWDCDFFDACWLLNSICDNVPEEREQEAYNALVIEVARLEKLEGK